MGYAFGASLLSYFIDGTPRPFSATFAVTNRCNLRCSYCNCPFMNPKDLDLTQIAELFDRLHQMGIRRLGIAGGEPMLRADLPDIIAHAKAHGFFVSVNTNLTLYHRHPNRLQGADLVYTSLDGDPDAHRAARGDHADQGVLAGIEALLRAGTPVVAICVVTEHSLGQTEFLLQQAEAGGFRMHFQPQCVDTEIVRGAVPDAVSNEQFRAFWRQLLAEKKKGRPIISSSPYLETLARWDDFSISARFEAGVRCPAGWGYLYVDPHGHAFPCAYTREKTVPVDLLQDDWRTTWDRQTPCTRCTVGPMLEFNLLFERPLTATFEAVRAYM